jgi:hypothetical protein
MTTYSGKDRRRVPVYRPELEWMEDRQLLAGFHLPPAVLAAESSASGPGLGPNPAFHSLRDSGHSLHTVQFADITLGDRGASHTPGAGHSRISAEALLQGIDPAALAAIEIVRHELQTARAERWQSASVVDEFAGRHDRSDRARQDSQPESFPHRSEETAAAETSNSEPGTPPPGPAGDRFRSPSPIRGRRADGPSVNLRAGLTRSTPVAAPANQLVASDTEASAVPALEPTPQSGSLLVSFLPFDPAVLDQAVQHFLDQVHSVGEDIGTWLTGHHEVSAVLILAGMAVAACELRRRRPERPTMQAAARDARTGAMPTILRIAAP